MVLGLCLCALLAVSGLPHYRIMDLGAGAAAGINDAGTVVGSAGSWPRVAYLFRSGQRTPLGTLPGYEDSSGTSVNAAGDAVGSAVKFPMEGGRPHLERAFLWQNDRMADIGTLGGLESNAARINNRGQIVGWANTSQLRTFGEGEYSSTSPIKHAFVWEQGKMTDVGSVGDHESRATGINDHGEIVGTFETKTGKFHAFRWANGLIEDLGWETGTIGFDAAAAINNKGQIVGNKKDRAVLWQRGKLTSLGRLNPVRGVSYATDINDLGQVVGTSQTTHVVLYGDILPGFEYHAFLYMNGRMRDLNKLIPKGTAWVLQSAVGINNKGEIVCIAVRPNRKPVVEHVLLLVPTSL